MLGTTPARLPDFVNWLWDSLSPMEKAECQNVLQEFINIALQQPGAKKEILSNSVITKETEEAVVFLKCVY